MVRKQESLLSADRYSLSWWLGGARNFFWVAVITLLIWVYADLEMSEPREFTATVRLTMSKAQQTVIVGQTDTAVTFSTKGSRRALAQFKRWLTDNDEVIEIDVSNYEPGTYSLPVVQILNQTPEIANSGLEAHAAAPSTLKFLVDRLETLELPVELDYVGATLAEGVEIDPQTVSVTAPENDWQRIRQQQEELVVHTVREELSFVRPGQTETRRVALVASIGGVPVQLNPKAVTIAFTVAQRTETLTISVTVQIVSPVDWGTDGTWRDYVLQKKDGNIPWRPEITVTGGKQDLEQLRPEDVQAFVTLTDGDKEPVESWLQRPVEIRFPAGLSLQLVGERPTVQFKLVRRTE